MRASVSKILTAASVLTLGGFLTGCGESVEGDFGDPTAFDQPASRPPPPASEPAPSAEPTPQPAPSSAPAVDPRIAQGKDLFHNGFCVKCHGRSAGGGKNGPTLAGRQWAHNDGSLAGIAATILSGVPEDQITDGQYTRAMKPGKLTSDEYEALAAYLLSLQ